MAEILIIAPLNAIGGINSWSKNMIKNFPKTKHNIHFVDNMASTSEVTETNPLKKIWFRATKKTLDLPIIINRVRSVIKQRKIDILHTTTSGSAGTFRDYFVARLCRSLKVKSIMQCRYGDIPNVVKSGGLFSKFLIHVMSLYDRVWVLDSKSYNILNSQPLLRGKVDLIPNPINCPEDCSTYPSSFSKVAFVASVIPSKGVLDLVAGIAKCSHPIQLSIIGNGSPEIFDEIKEIAKSKPGNWVHFLGKLGNEEAKDVIRKSDILALPTYYKFEAFPISILEAMSFGKLVIASDRAAIPDMLSLENGERCGIIVNERSPEQIADALNFCRDNEEEARKMCVGAFRKVKSNYSNEIVFEIYTKHYNELLLNE